MLINKNIYFVHVPRTGGRYITNLFKINKHEVSLDAFNTKWKNKEIGHLTYPDYEVYFYLLALLTSNRIDEIVNPSKLLINRHQVRLNHGYY